MISSSMISSMPARRDSSAFFRKAGATQGCSWAQSFSDWLKRFSPTPMRIGTTVAGGRVHERAVRDEHGPGHLGIADHPHPDRAHAQDDDGAECGGLVEPAQPVGIEALQRLEHRAMELHLRHRAHADDHLPTLPASSTA